MSPRLAPESEDPNSAIARFSSSTSRALIDRVSLRVVRSIAVTLASTLSPTAKRSARCSLRSRDSSDLRMNPGIPSPTVTSTPPSVIAETDNEPELGDVADLPLELGADRVLVDKGLPRIGQGLLQAEADAPLLRIDVEHHDLDLLAGRDDLAGMHVLLGPAHLGDMDQS